MVTVTGKLTSADRALLQKAQKHADAVNKRESDANFKGLANVLRAASTGSIVKNAASVKKSAVIKNASRVKKTSTIKRAASRKKPASV